MSARSPKAVKKSLSQRGTPWTVERERTDCQGSRQRSIKIPSHSMTGAGPVMVDAGVSSPALGVFRLPFKRRFVELVVQPDGRTGAESDNLKRLPFTDRKSDTQDQANHA